MGYYSNLHIARQNDWEGSSCEGWDNEYDYLRENLYAELELCNEIRPKDWNAQYFAAGLAKATSLRTRIFNDLRERLEQLVSKTVRIIRWNYRLAIPSYYPKGNNMSLLLPLDFMDTGKAQAALVVQMTESGNYMGHTLLNMRHAYLNARLISSQESSWLTA